jgi:transcriptional regulator with XRE-family HTH domain
LFPIPKRIIGILFGIFATLKPIVMSIGYKIRKLREDNLQTQDYLATILGVSQGELSKIENDQVDKIDFLFMDKVCKHFDKDFNFFSEENPQVNNVKKNVGTIAYNVGTINNCPENLLEQIKKVFEENEANKKTILALEEEIKTYRQKN